MTLSNPQLFAIFPRDLMDRLIFIGDVIHAGAKEPYPLFQPVRVRSLSDDLHKMPIRTRRTAVMVLQYLAAIVKYTVFPCIRIKEGVFGFLESVDSVERLENQIPRILKLLAEWTQNLLRRKFRYLRAFSFVGSLRDPTVRARGKHDIFFPT